MSDKTSLRASARACRSGRPEPEREQARAAIRGFVLHRCAELRLPPGTRVAAYEPLPSEPGSVELLAALAATGFEVIVPLTRPDRDLDWSRWTAGGNSEPLGVDAIAAARVVLVPAFAVDHAGNRLGRGGGSYDRALARADDEAIIAALLFPGEVLDSVPVEAWDRPVTAVVTPAGWQDVTPTGRGNNG